VSLVRSGCDLICSNRIHPIHPIHPKKNLRCCAAFSFFVLRLRCAMLCALSAVLAAHRQTNFCICIGTCSLHCGEVKRKKKACPCLSGCGIRGSVRGGIPLTCLTGRGEERHESFPQQYLGRHVFPPFWSLFIGITTMFFLVSFV